MATVQTSREYPPDTPVNRQELIGQGKYILVTAYDHGMKRVGYARTTKLLFRGGAGEKAFWINRVRYGEYGTWHGPPRLFTIENFGGMVPAKTTDIYDAELSERKAAGAKRPRAGR